MQPLPSSQWCARKESQSRVTDSLAWASPGTRGNWVGPDAAHLCNHGDARSIQRLPLWARHDDTGSRVGGVVNGSAIASPSGIGGVAEWSRARSPVPVEPAYRCARENRQRSYQAPRTAGAEPRASQCGRSRAYVCVSGEVGVGRSSGVIRADQPRSHRGAAQTRPRSAAAAARFQGEGSAAPWHVFASGCLNGMRTALASLPFWHRVRWVAVPLPAAASRQRLGMIGYFKCLWAGWVNHLSARAACDRADTT